MFKFFLYQNRYLFWMNEQMEFSLYFFLKKKTSVPLSQSFFYFPAQQNNRKRPTIPIGTFGVLTNFHERRHLKHWTNSQVPSIILKHLSEFKHLQMEIKPLFYFLDAHNGNYFASEARLWWHLSQATFSASVFP